MMVSKDELMAVLNLHASAIVDAADFDELELQDAVQHVSDKAALRFATLVACPIVSGVA